MGHGLTNADVHRVLDGLVGRRVEITIEWFVELADPSSGLQAGETSYGEARWAPSPSAGDPAVLEVGGKGMPVSGLGFTGGERVPGGVRWCHVLGRTTVVLADEEETDVQWVEAQRPDRARTFDG